LFSGCARWLGGLVVLASAGHARADDIGRPIEPSSEKVRIHYEAPVACPDREALLEGVRARIGSAWEAPDGELARQIDVRVQVRDRRFVATIEFVDVEGQRVTRSVGGEFCENVVNGIALVTALAIESRVEEALDQSEPAVPPAAATAPVAPATRPAPRTTSRPPPPAGPETALRAGVRGSGVTGVGPELALGAGLFGGLEWSALRFGLTFEILRSPKVTRNDIPADYTLASGRLEVGAGFWPLRSMALEAAGFLELGALRAETRENPPRVTEPGGGSAPFIAPGVVGKMLAFSEPLVLSLEVMGRFPLVREEFGVDNGLPNPPIAYKVRPFSAGAALGAGVRF
jgi:hypothetical protein